MDFEILITLGKVVGAIVTLGGAIKYIPMGWRWLRSRLGKKPPTSAKPDIAITQLKGHGDNIQTISRSTDSWHVLIRDLTVVNNTERDEVVSLKLWWPLNNGAVTFTPQRDRPPNNIPPMRLLNRVENIPARKSITGSLLFKILVSTVPEISAPFFIIIVKSELTGIERAFNSLSFTEVMKPYPRTLKNYAEKSQPCQKAFSEEG